MSPSAKTGRGTRSAGGRGPVPSDRAERSRLTNNGDVADVFDKLADLLEIEDANPFRVRAYRNAARVVREHPKSVADLLEQGMDLSELPGIGKDLAEKIATVVETGTLPLLEEVAARTPPILSDLISHIEGLGPKRVKALYQELNIRSIEELRAAADHGAIRGLKGFGEKTERQIQQRLAAFSGERARTLFAAAERIAAPLLRHLEQIDGVKRVTIAGSYRRCRETVGDLDVLVTARRGAPVMQRFVEYGAVEHVIAQGTTRSTVKLRGGMQVDLRLVPDASFGAALMYFTGSKAHNIAVRKRGVARGLKINEYGVFRNDERIAGRTEQEVYATVGLPYIPPELREDRGEIAAALRHELPELVRVDDIRGDLHCHTIATDGRNTLEQMVEAAASRGYSYMAITDHSTRATAAHGLDERRLRRQLAAIDALNERIEGFTVLKAAEVDILADGSLDFPDEVLQALDLTVCSVHDQRDLSREQQTDRILRAMDNRYFNILAHPTGRRIDKTAPYALDLERVLKGAKERGCFVELNAHADRLDLGDEACMLAKEIGVKVVLSTDAHSVGDLESMRFGVNQARRGWLSAADVLNTRALDELRALLRRS